MKTSEVYGSPIETDFPDNNSSALFKLKRKITGQTGNDGTKDVKNRNFWTTLEIPLISCRINFILTWSAKIFIVANAIDSQVRTFSVTDANFNVAVVALSTQDNIKLLKSGFKS